jgi:hypothetical protein
MFLVLLLAHFGAKRPRMGGANASALGARLDAGSAGEAGNPTPKRDVRGSNNRARQNTLLDYACVSLRWINLSRYGPTSSASTPGLNRLHASAGASLRWIKLPPQPKGRVRNNAGL